MDKTLLCNENLMKINGDIKNNNLYLRNKYTNKDKVIGNGYDFYNYLGLHLNDVKYINVDGMNDNWVEMLGNLGLLYKCPIINPFRIPIKLDKTKGMKTGGLCYFEDRSNDENNKFFSYIRLNKLGNELTSAIYIHEIMHVGLINNNAVTDKLNHEVLSVLMENLYGYYTNVHNAKALYNLRMAILKYNINILCNSQNLKEVAAASIYVNSILKAINLYDKFTEFSKDEQKEMINKIQDVLDKKITVEDMLNNYDVDYENSLDKVRKLVKQKV